MQSDAFVSTDSVCFDSPTRKQVNCAHYYDPYAEGAANLVSPSAFLIREESASIREQKFNSASPVLRWKREKAVSHVENLTLPLPLHAPRNCLARQLSEVALLQQQQQQQSGRSRELRLEAGKISAATDHIPQQQQQQSCDDWESDEDGFYESKQAEFLAHNRRFYLEAPVQRTEFSFVDKSLCDTGAAAAAASKYLIQQCLPSEMVCSQGVKILLFNASERSLKRQYKCKYCEKYFDKACALGGHISRMHKQIGAHRADGRVF